MKRTLGIIVGVVVVVMAITLTGGWFIYNVLTTPYHNSPLLDGVAPGETVEVLFEIEPGSALRRVTGDLETQGLIRWAPVLEGYARWYGYAGDLQAGKYLLSPDMSPVTLIGKIVGGDAVFDEITVTIPEGWSADDIEGYFEDRGLFSREEFQRAVVMRDEYRDIPVLSELADNTILDGYLFPDTYRIFPESTPESLVRRMVLNFQNQIGDDLLATISEKERTLHEILTLASIVQHESADDEEMPAVAGVFWNRLEIGMRLESDATVNYVLGTSKRQPTFADTAVQHPYNTYENPGLPPGPIGNPGLAAIRAAVFPESHDYLFFLHKPSREIVLSRSFTEHLANKARFLD